LLFRSNGRSRRHAVALAATAISLAGAQGAVAAPPSGTIEGLPTSGQLAPDTPTPVTVNAVSDVGVGKVALYAEDRLVGESATPPYTFQWQPLAREIFNTTLTAIITDVQGFSTTVFRRVSVHRFEPTHLRARTVQIRRTRRAPFRVRTSGSLGRPAVLTPAEACNGSVFITYTWKGGRALTNAPITTACRFRSETTFLPKRGRVQVSVAFQGNATISYTAKTHRARIR